MTNKTTTIEGFAEQKAAILTHLKRAVAQPERYAEPKEWSLSRVIWRAGEFKIKEATDYLVHLTQNAESTPFHYSNAWALGRCGKGHSASLAALQYYAYVHDDKAVNRIALEGILAVAEGEKRTDFIEKVFNAVPKVFHNGLVNQDFEHLHTILKDYLFKSKRTNFEFVEKLYLIDSAYPVARQLVVEFAKTAPLKPKYFGNLRHLFKAAEFRQDGQLFGILAKRLEKTNAFYQRPAKGGKVYIDGSWVSPEAEFAKKTPKVAYSHKTKNYLNRRVLRTLQRTGDLGDLNYVKLATGILLAHTEEQDGRKPSKSINWRYDTKKRRYIKETQHFDAYNDSLILNQILHTNSQRYKLNYDKTKWICQGTFRPNMPAPNHREEAFPALWDKMPQAYVHLMVESDVKPVQEFAVRSFKNHAQYDTLERRLDIPMILDFINKKVEIIAEYGVELAQKRYDAANPNGALVSALMTSPRKSARTIAEGWIEANTTHFLTNSEWVKNWIVSPYRSVRLWIRNLLTQNTLETQTQNAIIVRTFAHLMNFKNEGDNANLFSQISETLLTAFPERLKTLSLHVVRDLLTHPLKNAQVFAANILLNHQIPAERLPDDVMVALLDSKEAEVRQLGIQLFGQYSDKALLKKVDVLGNFYTSKLEDVRVAVRPIVHSLIEKYEPVGQTLVVRFAKVLLRKERFEGSHVEMTAVLNQELIGFLNIIDRALMFRLINSKHLPAQEYGTTVLKNNIKATDLTVGQIIRLSNHQVLEMRKTAWGFFEGNVGRMRYEREEALRLLDVDWDDSRAFGCDYFRQHYTEKDWTPRLLISICDSTRADIRTFGREMMTKFFKSENGEEYLLKLSQHPSADLQLFATNYLTEFASDKLEHLRTLEPFFITVLSAVNKSRVAKDRILAFLHAEAMKDANTARLVNHIIDRMSATIAIGDKAKCIEILRDIQVKYPHIKTPLTVVG